MLDQPSHPAHRHPCLFPPSPRRRRQVNEYPGQRTFKAIGSGGQDFVDAMVACAEKVVGPLHEECVSQRPSTKGNYVSVTISVWVESPDQVGGRRLGLGMGTRQ